MKILLWIVLGIAAGLVAGWFARHEKGALVLDVALALAVAFSAAYLFAIFCTAHSAAQALWGLIVAITVAVDVLALYRIRLR